MSVQPTSLTSSKIAKKLKLGHGQGQGSLYIPWLTIQEFTSTGRSHRVYSHKTQRIHHLFTDLELSIFLLLEWSNSVIDVRERFPLKREEAVDIAHQANLPYPTKNDVSQVLFSDFLVDLNDSEEPQFVINVRPSSTLQKVSVVNGLELERRYWNKKGIKQYIATEKQLNADVIKNIEKLAPLIGNMDDLTDEVLEQIPIFQWQMEKQPNSTVIDICKNIDRSQDQSLGTSLRQLKALLANRVLTFDIRKPLNQLRHEDISFVEDLDWLGEKDVAN